MSWTDTDWITSISMVPAGKYQKTFGGKEGGIVHWGPHGGMIDSGVNHEESLLIAMSDQQYLLELDLNGGKKR